MTATIMQRLRFSRELSQQVERLVATHMWHYSPEWSDGAVRRFVARIGGEQALDEAMALRRADLVGRGEQGLEQGLQASQQLQQRAAEVLAAERALSIADLQIDGGEVMKLCDLLPGPQVGELLRWLLEQVQDNPECNTKEGLQRLLQEHPRKS